MERAGSKKWRSTSRLGTTSSEHEDAEAKSPNPSRMGDYAGNSVRGGGGVYWPKGGEEASPEIGCEGVAEAVLEGGFLLLAHAFGHKASSL